MAAGATRSSTAARSRARVRAAGRRRAPGGFSVCRSDTTSPGSRCYGHASVCQDEVEPARSRATAAPAISGCEGDMTDDPVLAALERLEESQKTIREALGAITEIL